MAEPALVVIFLRGGADALNIVSPSSDADYIAARPEALRVLRQGNDAGHPLHGDTIADVDFRLHPQASELAELFGAGDLSVIHATGLTTATRSHFDAEARIERGSNTASDGGWLGRTLRHLPDGDALPALAVGTRLPESLRGSRAALAESLDDLVLAGQHWLAPALRARLQSGFGDHDQLGVTTQDLLALSQTLRDRHFDDSGDMRAYSPDVDYPRTRLAQPLMTVARTLKSDLGLRVATVDYGGWDTHANQAGDFAGLLGDLSRTLMAFWRDLGPRQQDVSVVIQSEFGRRLRSNASGGTDHGRAGAMMVLGPQARGGRLLGHWPGLQNEALEEGADLAVTTDYRDVLADILTSHMGVADVSAIFPNLARAPTGLFA